MSKWLLVLLTWNARVAISKYCMRFSECTENIWANILQNAGSNKFFSENCAMVTKPKQMSNAYHTSLPVDTIFHPW